jgi:hypothetical protein
MHCARAGIEELFTVIHTDALCIAPQILFHADALNALAKPAVLAEKKVDINHYDHRSPAFEATEDPEDNLEEVAG